MPIVAQFRGRESLNWCTNFQFLTYLWIAPPNLRLLSDLPHFSHFKFLLSFKFIGFVLSAYASDLFRFGRRPIDKRERNGVGRSTCYRCRARSVHSFIRGCDGTSACSVQSNVIYVLTPGIDI